MDQFFGADELDLNLLTFIAYVSTVMLALGAGMIVRAIFFSGDEKIVRTGKLRRARNVYDKAPSDSLMGRIDSGFDRLILESGLGMTPSMGFLWMLLFGVIAGGVALIISGDPLAVSLSAIGGMVALLVILILKRHRRVTEIREQLPHVLDMLARTTRAGRSVEQAISLVGVEAGGILGPEFHTCSAQLEMGRAFDKVMKSLAVRIPLVEFRILTTTLIVQRKTGGHLSDTLERMSGVVRDRITGARQIRAATGGGRTSAMIIASIAPLAFLAIFLLNRDHLDLLFTDSFGRMLLMTGVILEIVGLVWVYSLLRKEA